MKYIFNACDNCGDVLPREQLFNLTADDGERTDLRADAHYRAELAKWRGRMVAQFEAEGRGAAWVKGGVLQLRPKQLCEYMYCSAMHCRSPASSLVAVQCITVSLCMHVEL